jgi:hypothetical protein
MGQLIITKYAAMWDAPILLSKEECALGTGQKLLPERIAAMTDVLTTPRREECALGTVQRSKLVVTKNAPIKSRKEELVLGTGRR